MAKFITVTVGKKHIRAGEPEQCTNCPIALAVKELHPLHRVSIGGWWDHNRNTGRMYDAGNQPIIFTLSDRAKRFISKFDRRGPKAVKPTTFRFRVIS